MSDRNKTFLAVLSKLGDREQDPTDTITELVRKWSCNIQERTPRSYKDPEDGEVVTKLDLPCLLMTLAEQKSIVNLPTYRRAGAKVETEGKTVVSSENRHGPVVSLSSHEQAHSLGFVLNEANSVDTINNYVGDFKTFLFTRADGEFRDADAFSQIDVLSGGSAVPDRIELAAVVDPGRWTSVYGRPYLAMKSAILRLADEQKHVNREIKRLKASLEIPKEPFRKRSSGKSVEVVVDGFETALDGFDLTGEYAPYGDDSDALKAAQERVKIIRRQLKTCRFLCRVSDLAFVKHGMNGVKDVNDWANGEVAASPSIPAWAYDSEWETAYRPKGKQILWARRQMQKGIYLRCRSMKVTRKVSPKEAKSLQKSQNDA